MTKSNKNCVFTINGGSSSIKFSLYKIEESLSQLLYGEIESIGTSKAKLSFTNTLTHQKNTEDRIAYFNTKTNSEVAIR